MTNNYAIIQNEVVVNITVADQQFAQEQGWVELTGSTGIGWGYVDGQFVPPPPPNYSAQNKQQAESLLQATDWTATIDISDPEYSNPYLINQAEFLTYRSQIRSIAVNPPTTPAEFPNKPVEQWS